MKTYKHYSVKLELLENENKRLKRVLSQMHHKNRNEYLLITVLALITLIMNVILYATI